MRYASSDNDQGMSLNDGFGGSTRAITIRYPVMQPVKD
jgi:hypothetical protein